MWRICQLAAPLLLISSCAIISMRGVDPTWDGKQEPQCSESYTPVIIDGLVATSIASAVARDAGEWAPLMSEQQMIMAGAASLLYTASAAIGASKYKECRRAKAEWIARDAIERSHAETGRAAMAPTVSPAPAAAPASPAPPASTAPIAPGVEQP